jgi:hypothetical protein
MAGSSGISYNIEITEFIEKTKIAYRRYGGPLSGKGVIELRPLQSGTVLTRTGFYDDSLAEETIKSICDGIEQDNLRIKKTVENSKNV